MPFFRNLITNKHLSTTDKFALFINVIVSAGLLLSYLAPVVSPKTFWMIALVGLLYPLALLANIVFIIYWLIRVRVYVLIPVACILLGFNILTSNFGFRLPSGTASRPHIRLMAYNVHAFISMDQKKAKDEILKLIGDQRPDIINIEEYYTRNEDNDTIPNSLSKIVVPGYHYFKGYDNTQWDSTGVAIFTRFPIINYGEVAPTDKRPETQAIFADMKYGDKIIRVYCIHLQSVQFEKDEHKYLRNLTRYGKVDLHESRLISSKLKLAFIKRSEQVALIKNHIAKCPYPYIIAGDFNDTPISYAVNQLGRGLKSAFAEKGSGFGITYHGDQPNLQIDHILTSPQFDVLNFQIIRKKISDHYPIISDVALR